MTCCVDQIKCLNFSARNSDQPCQPISVETSVLEISALETVCVPESIMGVAVFDGHGLFIEGLCISKALETNWIQSICSLLNLQVLLASTLQINQFCQAIGYGSAQQVVVIRQGSHYVGFLMDGSECPSVLEEVLRKMQTLGLSPFRINPRFQMI
ncbi:MAG: hypothetical protein VKK04_04210 [Synechococcales bacterium]|nr:hypothetical protein [Synechococcales bacterium]